MADMADTSGDMFADATEEDIHDSVGECEDFSRDMFESILEEQTPSQVAQATKIGFSPTETVSTCELMFNISRSQDWPRDHPLADSEGLDRLRRSMFLESEPLVRDLPELESHLRKMLGANRKFGYRQLAARCVAEEHKTRLSEVLPTRRALVVSFLLRASKAVIPQALIGGLRNWRVYQTAARAVVNGDPGRPLLLGEIMKSFAVGTVRWLPPGATNCFRSEVMSLLMKWLVSEFLVTLTAIHFHVTRFRHDTNNMVFFHKPGWMKIEHAAFSQLIADNQILQLGAVDIQDSKKWPTNMLRMRLVPKVNGTARPILCGRKLADVKMLKAKSLLQLMVRLAVTNTIPPGCHHELEELLLRCKERFPGTRFLVVADIRNAFGSVDYQLMAQICDKIGLDYFQDKTLTQKYLVKKTREGRKVNVIETIFKDGTLSPTRDKSQGWTVVGSIDISGDHLKDLLEYATKSFSRVEMQYGSRQFQLEAGLPQGCLLSPLFCQLYYAAMDAKHLAKFSHLGILVRAVDDYLFVTDDVKLANEFKLRMEAGFPDFCCEMNKSKMQTTAPISSAPSATSSPASSVTFCGINIDAATFGAELDVSRLVQRNLGSTTGVKPLPLGFEQRIELLLSSCEGRSGRLSSLMLNRRLNGKLGVLRNIQVRCLTMAFKFVAVVKKLFSERLVGDQASAWAQRFARKTAKHASNSGSISYNAAVCVCSEALTWCLSRERGRFGLAIRMLKRMRRPSYRELCLDERDFVDNVTFSKPHAFLAIR